MALALLVASRGAERVLLGSGYPFDMGAPDCMQQVRAAPLTPAAKASLRSANATSLLRR